jgi:hypothetical protein
MKKILAITGLVAVTTMLHAQGYIDFTGNSAAILTNTSPFLLNGGEGNGTSGKTASPATGQIYDYILLYSATAITGSTAPTNTEWSTVDVFGTSTALLGTNFLAAGSVAGNGGSAGVQVAALASGTPYSVEIVGWTASLGSWSTVLADMTSGFTSSGYVGYTTGSVTPGSTPGGAGDPTVFTSMFANGSLQLYAVAPVPEPATMALTGLGALGLLLFRRRK